MVGGKPLAASPAVTIVGVEALRAASRKYFVI